MKINWRSIGIFLTFVVILALIPTVPWLYAQQNVATGRAYVPDYWVGAGTANAQTVAPTPVWASNVTGNHICWLPTAANSSTTPTLAVSGLTAKTITKLGHAALAANDINPPGIACVIYDGTDFQLQNPLVIAGSGTVNSGTANQAACYASTGTAVSGCPNMTDTSGGNTITSVGMLSKFYLENQGTAQSSGNIAITGWGTAAAVSAVGGYNQVERFTITAGSAPSANPTFAITFPNTFPATPLCSAVQIGGTGVVADILSGTESTTASGTLTWQATPTNAATYIIQVNCGL